MDATSEDSSGTLVYNEAMAPAGKVRECYRELLVAVESMGQEEFGSRRSRAGELLGEMGVTFPLPGDGSSRERPLPADWMPRIVPNDHWVNLSAGLLQRGKALNAWISALYDGDQDVVPREVVESSALYKPDAFPGSATTPPVHIYGPDVVHLGHGEYVVLEDNVRVPSGIAYAEAIRKAGEEACSELFDSYSVRGIDALHAHCPSSNSPPGVTSPKKLSAE